jgi:hypothetical protein
MPSVQRLECAFGASILDGAKIEFNPVQRTDAARKNHNTVPPVCFRGGASLFPSSCRSETGTAGAFPFFAAVSLNAFAERR